MNTLLLSKTLKFIGALLVVCAYLFLSKLSGPLAIVSAWIGISLFTTSFFIQHDHTAKLASSKSSKEVRSSRNREAEA